MKLWQTQQTLDPRVEAFTVGKDHLLDLELLPWDCRASQAHARMLGKTGLIPVEEASRLIEGLEEIIALHQKNEFTIRPEDEDGHTAIEYYLVSRLGEVGEKIHTGRSRNDQVLTALRLYEKHRLAAFKTQIAGLITIMDQWMVRNGATPLPGYTHTRKAMPSSAAIWAGAFRDAWKDDLELLQAVDKVLDQNPLGSGAGYGVPLPLDRQMTTAELGFSRCMENPLHAQNSRGKFEGLLLSALTQTLADINRLASDLIFFTMPGLDYFSLPGAFLTGSSIMPQKKNPDVLEILRAKYHELAAYEWQVRSIAVNLISGYHRDLQLTKEALMRGLAITHETLEMTAQVLANLSVNEKPCREAMTGELYAAEKACRLVEQGMPFRQAYRMVAEQYHGKESDEKT
jgi:argininosuccinate lyase